MTITASVTANNVRSLTPNVQILYTGLGRVDSQRTAETFIDLNFRHLVNRRMRWSTSEQFVRLALTTLVSAITLNRANTSINDTVDMIVNTVRDAANRRKSFNIVCDTLLYNVRSLVERAASL